MGWKEEHQLMRVGRKAKTFQGTRKEADSMHTSVLINNILVAEMTNCTSASARNAPTVNLLNLQK